MTEREVFDEGELRIMELYGKLLVELYKKGLLQGETADDIIARYRLRSVAREP